MEPRQRHCGSHSYGRISRLVDGAAPSGGMWRAVTAAEHAVKVAEHAGVPVGDLPLPSQGR
jgi:hypothetical protein